MRHIYRNIVIAALVLAPFGVAAQTIDLSALTAQIAQLQAQIAAQQSAQTTVAPQSSGSGARCVTLTRTLAKGDSGQDVTELQTVLINEGYLKASATGYFGAQTEAALKQWQSAHGIDALGFAGPRTRAALACSESSTGPVVISNQCPTIQKPTTCENAVSVQINGCTVGWQCSVATLPAQTFNASTRTGPTPLVVKFSGVVTSANAGFCAGNFCAATLVFGDGTTGAVPLPNAAGASLNYEVTHTYTTGGTFVANLYQGSAGSGAPLVGNGISITPIAPVITTPGAPTISVTPAFGTVPLPVTVTVGNVPSAANLSVEFGDGSFASLRSVGSALVATHTYINGGSYTIKLRRVNNAGESCVSATCQVLATTGLSIGSAQVATAALVATPSTGLAPLPVTFYLNGASTAYSGGVVLDFGDNTTEIVCASYVLCSQKTSTHTYAAAGTYTAQLLGFGAGGTTILKSTTVTVVTPQATSFTASPSSGAVPLAVTFTGNGGNQTYANGVIIKYGDDTTETFCTANEICGQKTKTHTYNDGSQYGAQLIGLGTGTASTTLGTTVVTATGGPTKINVTSPKGSARKGESVPLSWTIRGTQPTSGSLSFDLYTQAGSRIGTILTITNFQSGTATWKIPSSLDKNCTTTQPNGLCGVALSPGTYRIQANVTGFSTAPQLTTDAVLQIQDEIITAGGFTVSVTPSTAEFGKLMSIKYRVANPPSGGGVALWLVKPSGEPAGLIAGKLEADTELTTYPWNGGETQTCVAALFNPMIACMLTITPFVPGLYHVVAKVYTPFAGNYTTSDVTIHAIATSSAFTLKAPGTGASCTVLDHNFGPGDTDATAGGQVTVLQRFLAEDSNIYPEGTISGFYGNATRRAVERYQAAHSIASSGSPETNGYGAVGPSTRASIASNCSGNSTYLFRATPLSGRAPLVVTFSAKIPTSEGAYLTGYAIDFGDGAIGTLAPTDCTDASCAGVGNAVVSHTYTTNGSYIAKLMVPTAFDCPATAVCNAPLPTVAATVTVKVTNVTTPPPQACAAITRNLGAEDTDALTGGDVSRLQQFLAADVILYPEGLVTGFYGPATGRAVARYQASKGIAQTGTVGPLTLAAIRCVTDAPAGGIFSAIPLTGANPLFVRFATDRVITAGSYRVDFGDGTSQWLVASSTTHTYSTNGSYTAQLIRSVGNCFGLVTEALRLCEIGNTEVLGTKTITVSQAAAMSVVVTPSSVPMGGNLAVSWTTTNPPAGSIVRLEVYRDGATEPAANSSNDQGLASGSSNLAANAAYTWTLPTNTAGLADGGFGGFVMAPGTYHISAKLYTGSQCWGYCAGIPERNILATGKSGSFAVTAAGTAPGTGGTGGAVTGAVECTSNSGFQMMARVTLANGATRDFIFSENHPGQRQTQYADFAAAPTSAIGLHPTYWVATINGWAPNAVNTETGRTAGSISFVSNMSQRPYGNFSLPDDMVCSVSWH